MSLTQMENSKTSEESDFTYEKDYKYEATTDTFYKKPEAFKTWFDAVAACRSEGAQLVTPSSKVEAEMIFKLFNFSTNDDSVGGAWVGVHDLFIEGQFVTLDGRRADIYTDWIPNVRRQSDRKCLLIEEGRNLESSCSLKVSYICAKRRSDITRNHECETNFKGYSFENKTGHCYKMYTTPKTWRDAYRICRGEDASLAIVNSKVERELFVNYLAEYPEDTLKGKFSKNGFFLDFTDIITRGEFFTSNGETLEESGYNEWREGQPGNLDDLEHCGIINRHGNLEYLNCTDRAFFVCEKALKHS